MKYTIILRNELVEELVRAGIDMGKDPNVNLRYWVSKGLIPKSIEESLGKGGGRGKASYYPFVAYFMIKDLKELQKDGKKLAEIKEIFEEKFGWVYHREDLEKLKSLKFPHELLIKTYCEVWGIDDKGNKISEVTNV